MCSGCNISEDNITSTEIDETEQNTIESKYEILDTDLLNREFLEIVGSELLEIGINEYLSRYTSNEETFTISGRDADSDFPEELVRMIEIFLHDYCYGDAGALEKAYEELVNTFGEGKYAMNLEELCLLFPQLLDAEDQPESLEEAYRFLAENRLAPQIPYEYFSHIRFKWAGTICF